MYLSRSIFCSRCRARNVTAPPCPRVHPTAVLCAVYADVFNPDTAANRKVYKGRWKDSDCCRDKDCSWHRSRPCFSDKRGYSAPQADELKKDGMDTGSTHNLAMLLPSYAVAVDGNNKNQNASPGWKVVVKTWLLHSLQHIGIVAWLHGLSQHPFSFTAFFFTPRIWPLKKKHTFYIDTYINMI